MNVHGNRQHFIAYPTLLLITQHMRYDRIYFLKIFQADKANTRCYDIYKDRCNFLQVGR